MTSKRFIIAILVLTVAVAAAVAAINWRINFYGLYGDVRGQARTVTSNERWSKYLYAFNEIPSNYDGLLIGSSISANVNTSLIKRDRIYNISLSGANIGEERLIAERVLASGNVRLAIVCLYPYLVQSDGLKGGGMDERDYWAGLGSLPLLEDYLVAGATRMGVFAGRFSADGRQNLDVAGATPLAAEEAVRRALLTMPPEQYRFPIVVAAMESFRILLIELRLSGTQIVAYFPPIYARRYITWRNAFADFETRIRGLLAPGDVTYDFNDGSFDTFDTDGENFFDGYHLNERGSNAFSVALAKRVDADF